MATPGRQASGPAPGDASRGPGGGSVPPDAPAMPPAGTAVRLVGSLCAVFILSQFYRSAIAVIAPSLRHEAGLSAEALGLVTGAFFIAVAAMQLPVGVLLDRFGPRRTLPPLLLLTVAGAVVFSLARGLTGLIAGQALIGAGCAGVFMGGLVIFSRWFPPERFAAVSSLALATSGLGMMLSATPFAAFAQALGWRGAYGGMAAVTAALALVVFVVVRDAPPHHPYHRRAPESFAEALRGIGRVLAHPPIYGILAVSFVSYATNITVRGLWGGPYLADVHGLGAIALGNVLLAMSVATVAGTLVFGFLGRSIGGRRRLVLAGMALAAAALMALALAPRPSLAEVTVLLCVLGFSVAYYIHLLAHGRAFFPDHMVGRVMTTINFANFTGVGLIQAGSGLLIGAFPAAGGAAPEAAYRTLFAVLGLLMLAAAAAYGRTRDEPLNRGAR